MIRIAVSAFLALAVALPATASAADITGLWQAKSRGAKVQIEPCGDAYCGRVISAKPAKSNPELLDVNNKDPALRNRPMIGAVLMEGFKGGPRKWTGGRLYNPGDGNHYRGTITLVDDDQLVLKGCALVIICKSQTWTRLQ